jgi:hypothetical protein
VVRHRRADGGREPGGHTRGGTPEPRRGGRGYECGPRCGDAGPGAGRTLVRGRIGGVSGFLGPGDRQRASNIRVSPRPNPWRPRDSQVHASRDRRAADGHCPASRPGSDRHPPEYCRAMWGRGLPSVVPMDRRPPVGVASLADLIRGGAPVQGCIAPPPGFEPRQDGPGVWLASLASPGCVLSGSNRGREILHRSRTRSFRSLVGSRCRMPPPGFEPGTARSSVECSPKLS